MRRVLIAMVTAVLLGGVALTTVASANEDENGDDLHFIAKATSVEKTDLGDGGKQVVINFDLFEHHHDDNGEGEGNGDNGDTDASGYSAQDHSSEVPIVGHGVATCVSADASEGILCTGNVMTDDGQIASQGIVHIPAHEAAGDDGNGHDPVMLPITGGSGKYVGASGELEISHGGHGDGHGHGDTEMHALGMEEHGGGEGDGHGHHGLHLVFHLEGD